MGSAFSSSTGSLGVLLPVISSSVMPSIKASCDSNFFRVITIVDSIRHLGLLLRANVNIAVGAKVIQVYPINPFWIGVFASTIRFSLM